MKAYKLSKGASFNAVCRRIKCVLPRSINFISVNELCSFKIFISESKRDSDLLQLTQNFFFNAVYYKIRDSFLKEWYRFRLMARSPHEFILKFLFRVRQSSSMD